MLFQLFCRDWTRRPSSTFPIAPARSSFSSALRDLKAASVGPFNSLEIKCFENSCNN